MTQQKITVQALVPAILTPFAIMMQFGLSIGTVNSLGNILQPFYNESIGVDNASDSSELVEIMWSLTAAMLSIGGVFGSMLVKTLERLYGKRNTLIFIQIFAVVAVVLNVTSKFANAFEMILVGQFLMGLYVGVGIGTGSMYVAEISAKHIRGRVGSLFSVFISFGALVGNILGLKQIFGTKELWPCVFGFAIIPILMFLVYAPFLPKSPRHVYLVEKDAHAARKVLYHLRGTPNVEEEILELKEEAEAATHVKIMTMIQVFRSKYVRWQLISALVILSGIQITGFNGLQYYLNVIFGIAKIPTDIIPFISIGLITFQTILTVIMGFVSDKFGRKTLLVSGYATMCGSFTAFTVCLRYSQEEEWVSYLTIVCAFGVIMGFCIGPAPVTYSIAPELFDQVSRPASMSLGVCCLYISLVIVAFVTPLLITGLKYLAYVPYIATSMATTVFIYIVVPETKGKTFTDIRKRYDKLNGVFTTKFVLEKSTVNYINPGFELDEANTKL